VFGDFGEGGGGVEGRREKNGLFYRGMLGVGVI
jgi:hypothetical protein